MDSFAWEPLGTVAPRGLTEARLLVHHAVQLVAAVGRSLVPAREDDGHTSLVWRALRRRFAGQQVPGPRPWWAALQPEDLSLAVLADGKEVSRLALAGRTKSEAFAWLVEQARALGAPAEKLSLSAPYELPAHSVGTGATFSVPGDGSLAELRRWFANADPLLGGVADGWAGSAPVRIWPHHFDIGSVLPLRPARSEGDAATLGVGLSPGDDAIAEPYLYVTPWPVPEPLPALPAGGRWHREGFTGAVLTGSEVVAAGDGAAQAAAATAFLTDTTAILQTRHARARR
jgi:hypothetical protein